MVASSTIVGAFQRCVVNFENEAGFSQKEMDNFQSISIDNVITQIDDMSIDEGRKDKFVPFLDNMDRYGDIIEDVLGIDGIKGFIWVTAVFDLDSKVSC